MKKKITNNHFTIETRTIIENCLNEINYISQIVNLLQKDGTAIAREISKHKTLIFPSTFN